MFRVYILRNVVNLVTLIIVPLSPARAYIESSLAKVQRAAQPVSLKLYRRVVFDVACLETLFHPP